MKSNESPLGVGRPRPPSALRSPARARAALDRALLLACEAGEDLAARKALWSGARHDARNSKDRSALELAARANSLPIVKELIRRGAAAKGGSEALMTASACDFGPIVRELLMAGADPDALSPEGRRDAYACDAPLARAARFQCMEAIEALLEFGASPDPHPGECSSPLNNCLDSYGGDPGEREACLLRLLQAGCDPHPVPAGGHRGSPLAQAIQHGHPGCLRLLLLWKADPNRPETDGGRPLHLACIHDSLESAQALLAAGADPDAPTPGGRPAEFLCAEGSPIFALLDQERLRRALPGASPAASAPRL